MKKALAFALLASVAAIAAAAPQGVPQYTPEQISACIGKSSAKYQVHPHVVYAIAKWESNFNPGALSKPNKNGTVDHGIMQINDWWLDKVLWKQGIKKADLYDACYNIEIGTWILAQCIAKHGQTWRAVGCYNATSVDKQDKYIRNVMATFNKVRKAAGVQ
ncbi:MAG: lytic transglycosylase domain-containing protein [Burkholderiales bacterium]|nr:lytic transglycosylase domain-containing protein [Burkholderiales bacterium]